jgi:N-carbamoylputrescine amidase
VSSADAGAVDILALATGAPIVQHRAMSRARSAIAAVAAPFGRDLGDALARIEATVAAARDAGAACVVFPESTLGGYLLEPEPGEPAVGMLPPSLEPDGPEIARLVRIAGDTVVCVGYTEAGPAGERYASAVCVHGDGVLGRHRKVHLPPAERFAYTPGDGFAAFDTPAGRLGMLVCYDKLFPEAARALALDGAQIIACLSAWPADRRRPAGELRDDRQTRHFDHIDVVRAIENQVVWASANLTGAWGHLRFLGRSKVVDPDGVVLASTGHEQGVAVADVDPGRAIDEVLLDIDHLADRHPAAYGPAVVSEALLPAAPPAPRAAAPPTG